MFETSALTLGLGAVLLILSGVYLFHNQIAEVNYWVLRVLFPILLIIALSALFVPGIYQSAAEQMMISGQVNTKLQQLDLTIDAFNQTSSNISNGLGGLFGNPSQQKPEPSNIYAQTLTGLTNLIRWIVFISSTILLMVVTYLHYGLAGVVKTHELEKRVHRLEQIAAGNVGK